MDYCGYNINGKQRFFFIAGPCVIESRDMIYRSAEYLKKIAEKLGLFFIFKASYDKANRSSLSSYRGPGIDEGLKILSDAKKEFDIKVLTDIHSPDQSSIAAEVADVLQIPAFLCRQTDLLVSAAQTGKTVNVKKGQFIAPGDTGNIAEKLVSSGCSSYSVTERGFSFGYNNLIVDMRSFAIIKSLGIPVIFDATHSTQLPGGGPVSGGEREYIPILSRSAVAAGIDGLFMEVHHSPGQALCDAGNQYYLDSIEEFLKILIDIDNIVKS